MDRTKQSCGCDTRLVLRPCGKLCPSLEPLCWFILRNYSHKKQNAGISCHPYQKTCGESQIITRSVTGKVYCQLRSLASIFSKPKAKYLSKHEFKFIFSNTALIPDAHMSCSEKGVSQTADKSQRKNKCTVIGIRKLTYLLVS